LLTAQSLICTGSLALSANQQSLCRAREGYPNPQDLFNQAIRNLENNLGGQLKSFYASY
jgi:hypothetical protein